MSHYAKILNNKVIKIIVADADYFDTFIDSSPGEWRQVDKQDNYPGVGYSYDRTDNRFYPPQPYPSWTLNKETGVWISPVPHLNDNNLYNWNENNQTWTQAN